MFHYSIGREENILFLLHLILIVDQSTMAEGEAVDPEWWGYECKAGQILLYYNKTTGEHRWANGDQVSELLNITGC